jgi:zinc transport system permease protein
MTIIRTRITPTMRGIIMDELVLRALVGALILAVMMGPLGALVVWRQMAYFGDTIAHASLLGVAVSLLSAGAVPMTLAMLAVALAAALILARYARDTRFSSDTLLGIIAHGALALGVMLVAMNHTIRVDMNAYLFGDILAIDWADVAMLAVLAISVLVLLWWHWRALLMVAIDPAIAAVEGVHVARIHRLLTLLLATVIALAIPLTGVLLMTALLVMPAAAARYVSHTPVQMAIRAALLAMVSVSAGLYLSLKIDSPSGPAMVVCAALLFVLCSLAARKCIFLKKE